MQRALECKQAEEDRLGALQSLSTDADSEGDDDDDDDDAEEFFIEDVCRCWFGTPRPLASCGQVTCVLGLRQKLLASCAFAHTYAQCQKQASF